MPLLPLPANVERRRWTSDDLKAMEAAGILGHDDRVELIAGEIIRMSPKGARHEILRNELIVNWARRLPNDVKFAEEAPLKLDDIYEPESDIILFPTSQRVHEVSGDTVLLVVEIADSSLGWDLETKAKTYAMFGVREYWVINARTFETTVHLDPGADRYARVAQVPAVDQLAPSLVPSLVVRLADLPLSL